MNMGDVFAVFGTLLAIGIALAGMLLTWALIFPATVQRASVCLQQTPWRCFWFGLVWLLFSSVLLTVLFVVPSPLLRFVGWAALFALLTCASVGLAGLAMLMGRRLHGAEATAASPGTTLRGAVALELAIIFPVIGWFVVLPVVTICVLGAMGLVLLRGPARPVVAPARTEVTHAPHTP